MITSFYKTKSQSAQPFDLIQKDDNFIFNFN